MLIKAASTVAFKSMDDEDDKDVLIIKGYANTVDKDRAGDIITESFWKDASALEHYKKNPIILAYHDHNQPIGKAVEMEVTSKGLLLTARISKGAGPVYDLIKDGILSAFSIGFVIDEAKYNESDDTYYITKGRIHETSVVSVPCNQESLFSVSKSLDSKEYARFEKKFKPASKPLKTINKDSKMENELSAFEQMLKDQAAVNAVNTAKAVSDALAAQEALKVKAAAEALAVVKASEVAAANAKAISEASKASELVKALEVKLAESNEAFAKELATRQDEVVAMQDEIKSQLAARSNPVSVGSAVSKGLFESRHGATQKQVDDVVLLGIITKTPMFETKFGAAHTKTVNASSSIVVSSDEYEELFSLNLMMDIQNRITLSGMFNEITMNQRSLTIPMHPGFKAQTATWVAAAQVNTSTTRLSTTTGSEVSLALTEKQIQTFKLAAKTYMTEETMEDAILTLLPLLRENLIMAHVNSEEIAILRGTGSGQPSGLITRAAASTGMTEATTATNNGTTKVTALMIHKARRRLAEYGRNIADLTLVISNQAYWDLLEDSEWANVNIVGSDAVKLKGEVGRIYGMPVLVSDWFPTAAASSTFGVIFNRQNFLVARQRGLTVRTDFDIELDRTVIVATQRFNFDQYFADKGVVNITFAA